ncbi:MAG: (2Fe-2S)-binding protein [Gemmataceae bacterium]
MDHDSKVCFCFHVTRRKLLSFLRVEKPRVASELSRCGGAGTGCGWCVPFLRQLFDAHASPDLDALTAEEYARRRSDYLREGRGTPPRGGCLSDT